MRSPTTASRTPSASSGSASASTRARWWRRPVTSSAPRSTLRRASPARPGAAGIGTSRLASEVATEAAAKGWLVLTGRSLEKDGAPYGPFRDVLAGAVTNATAKVLNEAVGNHGPLLATLAPMLRQKVRGMGAAHEVAANKVREQLFMAIHALLTGVQGNKPLLIVLDDLQC